MGLARGTLGAGAGAANLGVRSVHLVGKAAVAGGTAATGGALAVATKAHSGVMAARRAQEATRMVAKPRTHESVDAGAHVQRTGTPARKQTASDAPAREPFTTGLSVAAAAKDAGKPIAGGKVRVTKPIRVTAPASNKPGEGSRRRGSIIPSPGMRVTTTPIPNAGQPQKSQTQKPAPPTVTAAPATAATVADGRPLGFQPANNTAQAASGKNRPTAPDRQRSGQNGADKPGIQESQSETIQRLEQLQQSRNRSARQMAARRNAAAASGLNRRRRGAA